MPLVLTLKNTTSIPVEVDSIRLETVREQSAADVARTLVQYGNKQLELGEFFDLSGSAADDNTMIWQGDCSRIKLIGTGLTAGKVIVDGAAGMHVGAEMMGGEIEVRGNAGDWGGAEMHGGRIWIRGNAGHCIGAVYRGGRRGMTGGEILIEGDCGNELAHTLRRGTIAVRGRVGDGAGFNMLAGTLLLFGGSGVRPGAGMRRGTIVYLGTELPPPMLPTYKLAGQAQPVYLSVYLRYLSQIGWHVPPECFSASYRQFNGDFLELGKGEILVRQAA